MSCLKPHRNPSGVILGLPAYIAASRDPFCGLKTVNWYLSSRRSKLQRRTSLADSIKTPKTMGVCVCVWLMFLQKGKIPSVFITFQKLPNPSARCQQLSLQKRHSRMRSAFAVQTCHFAASTTTKATSKRRSKNTESRPVPASHTTPPKTRSFHYPCLACQVSDGSESVCR